jgi:hypothetical protein
MEDSNVVVELNYTESRRKGCSAQTLTNGSHINVMCGSKLVIWLLVAENCYRIRWKYFSVFNCITNELFPFPFPWELVH